MKSNNLQPFYIISAHQEGKDNDVTDHCLSMDLNTLGLTHTEATGTYNNTSERCRVVYSGDEVKAKFLRDEYKQECYLYVHNDRSAELVYSDGTRKTLPGTFRPINPEFIGNDNYTKVGDKYYSVY